MEAFGDTLGHAGRFESLIHPIQAVIAFDRFACFRIPLGGSPGAGCDAAFTTDAEGFRDKDDTILSPLLNGTSRAGRNTPWFFTVKTGHENVCHPGKIVDLFWTNRYDLAEARTHWQIVLRLAVGFTTVTSDTAFGIVV